MYSFICLWKATETPALLLCVIDFSIKVGLSGVVGLDHVCSLLENYKIWSLPLSECLLLCWAKILGRRGGKGGGNPNQTTLSLFNHSAPGQFTSAWSLNESRCLHLSKCRVSHQSLLQVWAATKLMSGPRFQRAHIEFLCWAFVQVNPLLQDRVGKSAYQRLCQKPVNTKIKILQFLISPLWACFSVGSWKIFRTAKIALAERSVFQLVSHSSKHASPPILTSVRWVSLKKRSRN